MNGLECDSRSIEYVRSLFEKYFSIYCTRYREDPDQCITFTEECNAVTLPQLIALFQQMACTIEHLSLFSSNEEIEDVNTEDLLLLLVPFVLAELHADGTNVNDRTHHLRSALIYWKQFLLSCESLKVFLTDQLNLWQRETLLSDGNKRHEKIVAYRRRKELNDQIINLIEKKKKKTTAAAQYDGTDDEDVDRELSLAFIRRSIDEALQHQQMALLEIEILESSQNNNNTKSSHFQMPARQPFLYKITDVSKIRELYRQKVFKPFHELPTVSLAQVAELEMEREVYQLGAEEREKKKRKERKQKAVEEGNDVSTHSSESDENSSNEDYQIKARNWDDWKDENPRGSGNKNRNVG